MILQWISAPQRAFQEYTAIPPRFIVYPNFADEAGVSDRSIYIIPPVRQRLKQDSQTGATLDIEGERNRRANFISTLMAWLVWTEIAKPGRYLSRKERENWIYLLFKTYANQYLSCTSCPSNPPLKELHPTKSSPRLRPNSLPLRHKFPHRSISLIHRLKYAHITKPLQHPQPLLITISPKHNTSEVHTWGGVTFVRIRVKNISSVERMSPQSRAADVM